MMPESCTEEGEEAVWKIFESRDGLNVQGRVTGFIYWLDMHRYTLSHTQTSGETLVKQHSWGEDSMTEKGNSKLCSDGNGKGLLVCVCVCWYKFKGC